MECQKCNKEITDDSKFCPGCGEKLSEVGKEDLGVIFNRVCGKTAELWFLIGCKYAKYYLDGNKEKIDHLKKALIGLGENFEMIFKEGTETINKFLEIKDDA